MAEEVSRSLIDIHSHLYPEWYLDDLRDRSETPRVVATDQGERLVVIAGTEGVPLTPAFWSIEEKLRFMDGAGIGVSLVSPGNPWLNFVADDVATDWAGRINHEFAAFTEQSPDRLCALGVLPMSSIAACVKVVDGAPDAPGFKGFIVGTEICGLSFDEPGLDALWEKLHQNECVVLVHPGQNVLSSPVDGLGLTVGVSFPLETTQAAARLLLAGVPKRFPGIRWMLAHGAGTLPYLLGRLDSVWTSVLDPVEMARLFHADALLYDEETVAFAARRLGSGRLMWGSDHPFSTPGSQDVTAEIGSDTARNFLRL